MSTEDIQNIAWCDPENDYWAQTQCYYMTERGEVPVNLILKRDTIEFQTQIGFD